MKAPSFSYYTHDGPAAVRIKRSARRDRAKAKPVGQESHQWIYASYGQNTRMRRGLRFSMMEIEDKRNHMGAALGLRYRIGQSGTPAAE
jgi:hypothetical protein